MCVYVYKLVTLYRNNIPYNLDKRHCTITSEPEILDARVKECRVLLLQRHYRKVYSKRNNHSFISWQKRTPYSEIPKSAKCHTVCFKASSTNPEIHNVIRNNWPFLEEDPGMIKKILDISKLIKSKRQSPNLKTIFTRSYFLVILKKFLLSRDATNLEAIHVPISQKDLSFWKRK